MIEISDSLKNKSLLLAVSGGIDSVCLLHFFYRNKNKFQISKIGIAHIEHGIRGTESVKDALFVKNLAIKYNIPFYMESLGNILADKKNTEERARTLRYQILEKIRKENLFDFIVTAHHANDQAETLFMRIARGTSLAGLSGIHKFRADFVYRPFLNISKTTLLAYAKKNNLSWQEDKTNKESKYKRNFIRNEVLPTLDTSLTDSLLQISRLADSVYKKIIIKAASLFEPLALEESDFPFDKYFLPPGKILALHYDSLQNIFNENKSEGLEEIFRLWLHHKGFSVSLGARKTPLFPLPATRKIFKKLFIEKSGKYLWFFEKYLFKPEKNLYFYFEKLDDSLEWRYRKEGDVYTPEGTFYKKRKLAKWMQESGIPNYVRDYLPLLAKKNKVIRLANRKDLQSENEKGFYDNKKSNFSVP